MSTQVAEPGLLELLGMDRYMQARVASYQYEAVSTWTADFIYTNSDTGKPYKPHNDDERRIVFSDSPTYAAAISDEGGGKSVLGIIKGLDRIRRGMSGIMVSPNFPHFWRSLWPEFKRWCPWQFVIESQRERMTRPDWTASKPFTLVFDLPQFNYPSIICGGIDEPGHYEGPNVHWAHFDEARHADDAQAVKVLSGRIRLKGPNGEPPQLWLTTTPRKNWLYDYFGPLVEDDPLGDFKRRLWLIRLKVEDNLENLADDYVENRGATLTEAEKRVYQQGQWEDVETGQRFLPSITLWDACLDPNLPPLTPREPMVLAADAASVSDCFALVGVTRHPLNKQLLAVRYSMAWQPTPGNPVDFDAGPLAELTRLRTQFNVIALAYDPTELRYLASKLVQYMWLREVKQGTERLEADSLLLTSIINRKLVHSGEPTLRAHIDNADKKLDADGRKLRIVKRVATRKIDLAVALSMAHWMFYEYPNL